MRERADAETASEGYARRFSGAVGAWFLRLQTETTIGMLRDLPPGSRVLDVGGGHGQLAGHLAAAGYETVVIGSGPEAGRGVEPLVRAGAVRFDVGDLLHLPYGDAAFDAAISFRLLPHTTRWRELIAELCRVAGRCVVVDYPSIRSVNVLADRLFGLKRRVEGNTRPFALFHPTEIDRTVATQGFRTAAVRAQFFFPMALHRAHRSAALARMIEWPPRRTGLTRRYGSPVILRADRVAPIR